ncbi:hypothetical protein AC578_2226 [Pseudocercospora eumusae]|uniref:Uncharacterized protein n=1 Tax=Pseudocercospora eumusae TaxID=321146 RepID=A0A139HAW3_9PEZI|nr:hypothetical protein AC578_2226 [Pseudocercospora eumusae]
MVVKTAYVTGGASGIGRAVVEMLGKRGVRVAVADVDLAGAKEAVSSLKDGVAVELDAASWDSQVAAFQKTLEEFGRMDYVFAIAGIGEKRWLENDAHSTGFVKPDLTTLDVDLNGVLYTAALAIQQMRRQEPDEREIRGKSTSWSSLSNNITQALTSAVPVTVVASVCGFYCVPTLPIYTAAKHGVVGFVRSYGKHLLTEAITLNAICPDVVRTSISTEAFYSKMEAKGLLVSMESVIQAFEQCLDDNISGETLEIEPKSGVFLRSGPEPYDKEAEETLKMLHQRALHLQQPSQ